MTPKIPVESIIAAIPYRLPVMGAAYLKVVANGTLLPKTNCKKNYFGSRTVDNSYSRQGKVQQTSR